MLNIHHPLLLLKNLSTVIDIKRRINVFTYRSQLEYLLYRYPVFRPFRSVSESRMSFLLVLASINKPVTAISSHSEQLLMTEDWAMTVLRKGWAMHAGKRSLTGSTSSPFHDNEQALFPMVHVFIEAQDTHYVLPAGDAPVQLHLAARFRAVVENLQNTERRSRNKVRREN